MREGTPSCRRRVLPLLIAAVLPAPARRPTTHRVSIREFQFVPARVEVAQGDIVVWTNHDVAPHTATAKRAFDSKKLNQGKSWSMVARQKGSFRYLCLFHPSMQAELIVK